MSALEQQVIGCASSDINRSECIQKYGSCYHVSVNRRTLLLAPFAPLQPWPVEAGSARFSTATCETRGARQPRGRSAISRRHHPARRRRPGGKTYDSVSRMMPALAAWAVRTASRSMCSPPRSGTPSTPPSGLLGRRHRPAEPAQVESSIVAWSLWIARDLILPKLSSAARANINAWLAACTVRTVRTNNWAWFTASTRPCGSRWPPGGRVLR